MSGTTKWFDRGLVEVRVWIWTVRKKTGEIYSRAHLPCNWRTEPEYYMSVPIMLVMHLSIWSILQQRQVQATIHLQLMTYNNSVATPAHKCFALLIVWYDSICACLGQTAFQADNTIHDWHFSLPSSINIKPCYTWFEKRITHWAVSSCHFWILRHTYMQT